jgi:hypothetical protein
VNLLALDEPTVGESPTVARCRCCKRLLTADDSLGYVIGPTCRKRLGITSRQRVRLARVKPGGDCEGQGDLLEAAMPGYITTDASDYYHASEDCSAFQAGRRGSEAAGYQLHEIRRVTAELAAGMKPCQACLGPTDPREGNQ